jgi:TonB family protein
VWLYERSLKEVHEYMADDEVLKQGVPKGHYQALLVNQAMGGPVFTISHQFNQSLILKRILMMTKMKSSRTTKFKPLFFIPLTAGLLMAFSNPEPIVNPVIDKVEALTQQITDPDLFHENVNSLNNQAIQKEGITIKGKVIDGSTSNPIKGVNIIVDGTTTGTTSDANGAFEIKADGSNIFLVFSHISYTTTLVEYKSDKTNAVIKLNKGTHDLNAVTVNTTGNIPESGIKPHPYVLVDGVAVDEETFKALDPDKIESVNILKNESATAVYGEKGKNGVIMVVTKKADTKDVTKATGVKASDIGAVFTVVEEMPSFPGGESERARFISNNLKIPAESIEGTVYVSFIVKSDGSIANAKILRGLGKSYDEEVLRVINLMPKWLPGTQNGEVVDVLFNMPVKFEKK